MDYQELAAAKVDALDFLSALATEADLTAGTYGEVLDGSVGVGDVSGALVSAQSAANGVNAATGALQQVSQALTGITTRIAPGKMIDLGPYRDLATREAAGRR